MTDNRKAVRESAPATSFRDQAVRNVDEKYGCTVEFSSNPEAHRDEYAAEEARLKWLRAPASQDAPEQGWAAKELRRVQAEIAKSISSLIPLDAPEPERDEDGWPARWSDPAYLGDGPWGA